MKISWKNVCLSAPRPLTAGGVRHDLPRAVPGTRWLVHRLRSAQGGGLILTDRKGRLVQPLVLGPGEYGPLAPLPGGAAGIYAFRGDPEGHWGIRSVAIPGGGHAGEQNFALGAEGVHLLDPVAHPDGEHLVFASDEAGAGRYHLWELTPGRREKRPLTSRDDRSDDQPAFSPSGRFLAFRGTAAGAANLFLFDRQTLKTRQLTAGEGESGEPVFLDEFRLVFSRRLPGGDSGLLLLDTLAGREAWLTGVLQRARQPTVYPCSRRRWRVVYTIDGPEAPTAGAPPPKGPPPAAGEAPPAQALAPSLGTSDLCRGTLAGLKRSRSE